MSLSSSQHAALAHVREVARRQEDLSRSRVAEALHRAGCGFEIYDEAMECIRSHARVVIHFHPDRHGARPIPVAQALLDEGVYRNQFETGLSSGGLSASAGGARDSWERALFGAAYHADGVKDAERPRYGALELIRHSDGPIPRFGSCYFVLRPSVSRRSSFTFQGSQERSAPDRLGTIDRMDRVMALLLAEIEAGGVTSPPWPPFRAPTLGVPNLTVAGLLRAFKELASVREDPADLRAGRVLDSQIEAQVHGPIDMREDVELLVVDPAFAAALTGELLHELASRYGFPLRWHCGFQLPVAEVPDDFRGQAMPRLAHRIAGKDGTLDAAVIGAADASLHQQPDLWRDWGTRADVLQHLKQLWHVLVHYGRAAGFATPTADSDR